MNLFDNIRDVLAKSEGMNVYDLCVALGMEDGRSLVQKCCSNARYEGRLTSAIEGGKVVYRLPAEGTARRATSKPKAHTNQNAHPNQKADGAVSPPVASSKKPKLERVTNAVPRRRDFLAACESADKTLKALTFAASTADDALQVYLHSVADPAIYDALKAARDQAHAAVAAFTSRVAA